MEYTIYSLYGEEIWAGEASSIRDAVEQAHREGLSLNEADLKDADLRGARLSRLI